MNIKQFFKEYFGKIYLMTFLFGVLLIVLQLVANKLAMSVTVLSSILAIDIMIFITTGICEYLAFSSFQGIIRDGVMVTIDKTIVGYFVIHFILLASGVVETMITISHPSVKLYYFFMVVNILLGVFLTGTKFAFVYRGDLREAINFSIKYFIQNLLLILPLLLIYWLSSKLWILAPILLAPYYVIFQFYMFNMLSD